jgi:hypothetical protein
MTILQDTATHGSLHPGGTLAQASESRRAAAGRKGPSSPSITPPGVEGCQVDDRGVFVPGTVLEEPALFALADRMGQDERAVISQDQVGTSP